MERPLHDRADREREHGGADAGFAAERPAAGEHRQLEDGPDKAQRTAGPGGQTGHQPVAVARVRARHRCRGRCRRRTPGRRAASSRAGPARRRVREVGEDEVDDQADLDGVEHRAEARSHAQRDPDQRAAPKPTTMIAVPIGIPVRSLRPSCSTSQGARPMSPATIRATPRPHDEQPDETPADAGAERRRRGPDVADRRRGHDTRADLAPGGGDEPVEERLLLRVDGGVVLRVPLHADDPVIGKLDTLDHVAAPGRDDEAGDRAGRSPDGARSGRADAPCPSRRPSCCRRRGRCRGAA